MTTLTANPLYLMASSGAARLSVADFVANPLLTVDVSQLRAQLGRFPVGETDVTLFHRMLEERVQEALRKHGRSALLSLSRYSLAEAPTVLPEGSDSRIGVEDIPDCEAIAQSFKNLSPYSEMAVRIASGMALADNSADVSPAPDIYLLGVVGPKDGDGLKIVKSYKSGNLSLRTIKQQLAYWGNKEKIDKSFTLEEGSTFVDENSRQQSYEAVISSLHEDADPLRAAHLFFLAGTLANQLPADDETSPMATTHFLNSAGMFSKVGWPIHKAQALFEARRTKSFSATAARYLPLVFLGGAEAVREFYEEKKGQITKDEMSSLHQLHFAFLRRLIMAQPTPAHVAHFQERIAQILSAEEGSSYRLYSALHYFDAAANRLPTNGDLAEENLKKGLEQLVEGADGFDIPVSFSNTL